MSNINHYESWIGANHEFDPKPDQDAFACVLGNFSTTTYTKSINEKEHLFIDIIIEA